jgi:hypothetical protein
MFGREDNEMANQTGENESRTLSGGEIVHLVKEPGRKWKIRFYECHHRPCLVGPSGALFFAYLECLPENWKDREFDTSDEAANFVQQEIRDGKVPANSQSTP